MSRPHQLLLTVVLAICATVQVFLFMRHPVHEAGNEQQVTPASLARNETLMARLRQQMFCEDAPALEKRGGSFAMGDIFVYNGF